MSTLTVEASSSAVLENASYDNIIIKEGASLVHVCTMESSRHSFRVSLQNGASYDAVFLQSNNTLELDVSLEGAASSARIKSIAMCDGRQDNDIKIFHKASHSTSDLLVKNIASKKGLSDMNFYTFIEKGLEKVEGYQLLKGLVMDDDAKIKSKPELAIYSDDVKCSHGSAVGGLDEKQKFYLSSRGIDALQVERLLVYSFANEIIEAVGNEKVKNEFLKKIGVLEYV